VEDGVELHLTDDHADDLVSAFFRTSFVGIGKCSAYAAFVRMA